MMFRLQKAFSSNKDRTEKGPSMKKQNDETVDITNLEPSLWRETLFKRQNNFGVNSVVCKEMYKLQSYPRCIYLCRFTLFFLPH